ncbi:MAG TPA: hypothetical protein VIU34_14105, partial [Steroidobacter sp.]
MAVQDVIDFAGAWRTNHGILDDRVLSEAELTQFATDLQAQIQQLSIAPPAGSPNASLLLYNGTTGELPSWQAAKLIAEQSNGKYFYISQTEAGLLLNDDDFRAAVRYAVGDVEGGDRLIDGEFADGHRTSRYGVGDILAVNDFVSQRLVAAASGDVTTLTTHNVDPTRVFAMTELPALLENPNVTAINGIPISVFQRLQAVGVSTEHMLTLIKGSSLLRGGSFEVLLPGKTEKITLFEMNRTWRDPSTSIVDILRDSKLILKTADVVDNLG